MFIGFGASTIRRKTSLERNYLAYVDSGPPDKRVIAQLDHELDVVHDIAPEGMFALAKQSKATRAWFKVFPYGHPDPTLPAVIFNTQNELFKDPDVRWALALLISRFSSFDEVVEEANACHSGSRRTRYRQGR